MAENTEERKAAVLEALASALPLADALELTGVPDSTYRYWRQSDATFAQHVQALLEPDVQAGAVPVADTQYALDCLASQVSALEHQMHALGRRVTELEREHDQLVALSMQWDAIRRDSRTMKALHLWAQRTVGQSRGPLPDFVKALAIVPEPPEAA